MTLMSPERPKVPMIHETSSGAFFFFFFFFFLLPVGGFFWEVEWRTVPVGEVFFPFSDCRRLFPPPPAFPHSHKNGPSFM